MARVKQNGVLQRKLHEHLNSAPEEPSEEPSQYETGEDTEDEKDAKLPPLARFGVTANRSPIFKMATYDVAAQAGLKVKTSQTGRSHLAHLQLKANECEANGSVHIANHNPLGPFGVMAEWPPFSEVAGDDPHGNAGSGAGYTDTSTENCRPPCIETLANTFFLFSHWPRYRCTVPRWLHASYLWNTVANCSLNKFIALRTMQHARRDKGQTNMITSSHAGLHLSQGCDIKGYLHAVGIE